MPTNKTGKFIVIDGIDSSGKSTQVKLIKDYLELLGFKIKTISFPQYERPSSGPVKEYLEGRYGASGEVSPYQASILYAVDRFDAKQRIKKWLDKGHIVIANRYVTANLAHQGGKLDTALYRRTFYDWARNLEYKIFEIPQPDAVFILEVSAENALKLMESRQRQDWQGKKRDIHEYDYEHLKRSEHTFTELARLYSEIIPIACAHAGHMLSVEEISRRIWRELSRILRIKYSALPPFVFSPGMSGGQAGARKTETAEPLFYRLHPEAYAPRKINDHQYYILSSGWHSLLPGESVLLSTGLSLNLPADKLAWLVDEYRRPRHLFEPDYKKEIKMSLSNHSGDILHIRPGEVVGKIIIVSN